MAILEGLLDAAELTTDIAGAMSAGNAPAPPPSTASHLLPVTVVNRTQFTLVPAANYFDSGRFELAPSEVPPFRAITFTVCSTDNSILTGVTGAVAFQATLTNQALCNLGVGFANPEVGSFKANAAFDPDSNQPPHSPPVLNIQDFVQGTYDGNSSNIVSTTSAKFSGTDTKGNPTTIQLTGESSPGAHAVIVFLQTITAGGA